MADFPIRFPGDHKRIYIFKVDELLCLAFKPGLVLDRLWIEDGKLYFIAGPARRSRWLNWFRCYASNVDSRIQSPLSCRLDDT